MGTSARSATAEFVEQAKRLEPLGWSFEPTKAGATIRNPDGDSVGLHTSGGSDVRTIRNLRADLTRIGFFAACEQLEETKRATGRAATAAARKRTATAKAVIKPGGAAAFFSASSDDTARPSSVRGITTRSEDITPARAEELLARAITVTLKDGTLLHQRRIFEREIAKWVHTIEAGQWIDDMPEGLSLTADGSLINGRHRLTALVRTGRTLRFRVHYNVPVECFAAIDTGKPRTAADTLAMAGYANSSQLNSALKLQVCYDMWLASEPVAASWTQWHKIKLNNRDMYEAALRYPDMGQHVREAFSAAKPSCLSSPALAVFLLSAIRAWPEGRDRIDDFRIGLQTGEGLCRGDAAYELREWARRRHLAADGTEHKREIHLRMLTKMFRPYAEGKLVRGLPRFDDKQPMVEPYSPRQLRVAS